MSTIDIAVLDHDAHGIPAADYAEILTRRLPDREVRLAATPDEHRRYLGRRPSSPGSISTRRRRRPPRTCGCSRATPPASTTSRWTRSPSAASR